MRLLGQFSTLDFFLQKDFTCTKGTKGTKRTKTQPSKSTKKHKTQINK